MWNIYICLWKYSLQVGIYKYRENTSRCVYIQKAISVLSKTNGGHIAEHGSAFALLFLPCKSSKYYVFWMCVCCLRCHPLKSHAQYHIVTCGLSTTFFHIISKRARILEESYCNWGAFYFSCKLWIIFHFEEEFSEIWSRNDGNASIPEQVKRPNPWKKKMMMIKNVNWFLFKVPVIIFRY